jgi:hypothetical protein
MSIKPARAFRVERLTLRSLKTLSDDSEKTERTWLADGESGIASSETNQEPLAGFDINGGAALWVASPFFLSRIFLLLSSIRARNLLYFNNQPMFLLL